MEIPGLQVPPDLAQWSIHCFCLKARRNPKRVIELDNNGQILYQAIGGTTSEVLGGLPCTDSQLYLLETFRLIERNEGIITTAIPVLGPGAAASVRTATAQMAKAGLTNVSKVAAEIGEVLTSRGLGASAFAVVFGHALDGVLWDVLRERGSLPEVELAVDEPHWRGALWAIYPGREGSAGTNELTEGNNTLIMVWDDASVEALWALESHPETHNVLRSAREDLGTVSLQPILGTDVSVPVIARKDQLHTMSLQLAAAAGDAIADGHECQALLADAGVNASVEEATVIVAHELIWELTELLKETSTVEPPPGSQPDRRVFVIVNE